MFCPFLAYWPTAVSYWHGSGVVVGVVVVVVNNFFPASSPQKLPDRFLSNLVWSYKGL